MRAVGEEMPQTLKDRLKKYVGENLTSERVGPLAIAYALLEVAEAIKSLGVQTENRTESTIPQNKGDEKE